MLFRVWLSSKPGCESRESGVSIALLLAGSTDAKRRQGVQERIQGDVPFGGDRSFVLGAKNFEILPSLAPHFLIVGFHDFYNFSLLDIVQSAEIIYEAVDVEHGCICRESYNDDDSDQSRGRELVVNAPK